MTSPPDPVLEIQGLSKSYGDHVAVDRLDMVAQRGEVFGVQILLDP